MSIAAVSVLAQCTMYGLTCQKSKHGKNTFYDFNQHTTLISTIVL